VMRAYTPTSNNNQKGYFDLVIKVNPHFQPSLLTFGFGPRPHPRAHFQPRPLALALALLPSTFVT
jgi:hypothetical protein